MTKVKTILAEFCSPKDILAINRMGLLKKEERESQPIPWRHRLNNRERRELVRSELRASVRPSSHTGRKDHVRAINSAKCPKDSKMGECLISSHTKSSSLLAPSIGRISNEQRRVESRLQQHKMNFLRNSTCLNHEPLILVERPATPKVKSRAAFMKKHGIDPAVVEVPRYMRPTQSSSRTPSTLTSIEAFTVDAKKKKNIWEEAVSDRDELKFKSTSKSSAALTNAEIKMLRVGHALHKPTEQSICRLNNAKTSDDENDDDDDDDDDNSPPPSCVSGKKKKKGQKDQKSSSKPPAESVVPRPETVVGGSIFITQMSANNKQRYHGGGGGAATINLNYSYSNNNNNTSTSGRKGGPPNNKLKSVTFSDFGNTPQVTTRSSSSKKGLLGGGNGKDDLLRAERDGRAILRKSGRQESSETFGDMSISSKKTLTTTANSYRSMTSNSKQNKPRPFLSLVLQS